MTKCSTGHGEDPSRNSVPQAKGDLIAKGSTRHSEHHTEHLQAKVGIPAVLQKGTTRA